jgi:hypothetical protein
MNVDLNAILQRWMSVDSHEVFEGHLPGFVPIDYIDKEYMPEDLFESFTTHVQQIIKNVFGDSLILTDHVIDLNSSKKGIDPNQIAYENFVHDAIREQINKTSTTSYISRGTVITVATSKFEEYVALPISISQSYSLDCLEKPPTSSEMTYIYWQAMHGDLDHQSIYQTKS